MLISIAFMKKLQYEIKSHQQRVEFVRSDGNPHAGWLSTAHLMDECGGCAVQSLSASDCRSQPEARSLRRTSLLQ